MSAFDESEHHGSLLLDNGTRLAFPASAFEASGLRLLRVGQRVRVERSSSGDVTLITLITLPQSVA